VNGLGFGNKNTELMFRRRRTNEKEKVPPAVPSLGAGDGGLWYKKPASSSTPSGTTPARSVASSQVNQHFGAPESPQMAMAHQTSGDFNMRHQQRPQHAATRDNSPRHLPTSPNNIVNQYATTESHTNRHGVKPLPPPIYVSGDHTKSGDHAATADFVGRILHGDWKTAIQMIDQDPKCARHLQSVTLRRQNTVVYPLHAAVCMNPPLSFLEKLVSAFPTAVQIPDDQNGRMPLHWACLSSAPAPILRKLVDMYPTACKVLDKSHGRLPVHYLAIHAHSLQQLAIVLEVEQRGVISKDKQSKTPLDLAQESSNPLRLQILSEMQKLCHSVKMRSSREEENKESDKDQWGMDWKTSLNVNVAKPLGPLDALTVGSAEYPVTFNRPQQTLEYRLPVDSSASNVSSSGRRSHPDAHNPLSAYNPPPPHRFMKAPPPTTQQQRGVPKPPMSGGFLFNKLGRNGGKSASSGNLFNKPGRNDGKSVSSGGSAEDPGPKTATATDLPRPNANFRQKTWTQETSHKIPSHFTPHNRLSAPAPDNFRRDAYDIRGDDDMPMDPLSNPPTSLPRHPHRTPAPLKPPPPPSLVDPTRRSLGGAGKTPPLLAPLPVDPTAHAARIAPKKPPPPTIIEQQRERRVPTNYVSLCDLQPKQPFKKTEQDYMELYAQKMAQYSPSTKGGAGVNAKTTGQYLVDGMKADIHNLNDQVTRHKDSLQEKDAQLTDLDGELEQMTAKEQAINVEFQAARTFSREQRDLLQQKIDRMARLNQQIAGLQEELRHDEAGMESIECAMLVYEEKAARTESMLKAHHDQQGNLGAIRQALEEERASITRDLTNCESELKSLEVIQNLALDM
jgi:hypothetical protein